MTIGNNQNDFFFVFCFGFVATTIGMLMGCKRIEYEQSKYGQIS